MDILITIILVLLVVVPVIAAGGLFICGAVKDGQVDRALQARLGFRRRTRLGAS